MIPTVRDVMEAALSAAGVSNAQAFRALSREHDAFWRRLTRMSPIPDPLPPDIDAARELTADEENRLYSRLHALPVTEQSPIQPEWIRSGGIKWPWCDYSCGSFQFMARDKPRCAITGIDTEPDPTNGRSLCVPSLTVHHLRFRRPGK